MELKEAKPSIIASRTCRLGTLIKKGKDTGYPRQSPEYSKAIYNFLVDYGRRNLISMFQIIDWSRKKGMTFYRMSSDMFPHINNFRIEEHLTKKDWSNYINLSFATDIIYKIGCYAQYYQVRLTMHPGPYNQLGADNPAVLRNTFADLSWHGILLELLYRAAELYRVASKMKYNTIQNSILCIHGGGMYGDKKATLERWKAAYRRLPEHVRKWIAVENDEKAYCVDDLLPMCREIQIPLIFDFHHYNCWSHYHQDNPHQRSIDDLLPEILNTWKVRNKIPKFHLSDQNTDKKIGAHHDYVESIPQPLLDLIRAQYKCDIMIEAKQKERATLRLYTKYQNHF